jgi:hypothetical protein
MLLKLLIHLFIIFVILNLLFSGIYDIDNYRSGNDFEKGNTKLMMKGSSLVILSIILTTIYLNVYYNIVNLTQLLSKSPNKSYKL